MHIEISFEERNDRATGSRDYHVSYTRGQSKRRPQGEDKERAGRGGVRVIETTYLIVVD